MWWHYILVFFGALLFDVVFFPFPPAFTIMVFLQVTFDLNTWLVIIIGVFGSIAGRYILTLYIPLLSNKYFRPGKNKDIQFLGNKMKEKGWKSQIVVLAYSFLPLPTTPLFVAAGMGKVKPQFLFPAFFIGKFTSDAIAVHLGKYASDDAGGIFKEALSWKSIAGLIAGLLMLCAILFIDWRTLIQKKKFQLKFKVLK